MFESTGGLSRAQAKRQRRELLAEIEREQKRKDRARIAELRTTIRDVLRRRKEARAVAVVNCRAGRARLKVRAEERRKEAFAKLKADREADVLRARQLCTARKMKVKTGAQSAREKGRALLAETRALQKEIARIDRQSRQRDRALRSTAVERRAESDDEVRSNIPADLVPLFERVKRKIRGSERHSRTEAFLHFAEEHPGEVVDAIEHLSSRELKRLQAEEAAMYRELERQARRRAPKKARARRAPPAAVDDEPAYYVEVPF